MQYLFGLVVFELALLMWLHINAVERNLQAMQRHLATRKVTDDHGIWIQAEGMPYSFRICPHCVDHFLQS